MNKECDRYFRRKAAGGRSRAAALIDAVVLRFFLYAALYLWFRSTIPDRLYAALFTVVCAGLLSAALMLWRRLNLERFREKEILRLRQQILLERLLLLPEEQLHTVANALFELEAYDSKTTYPALLRQVQPITPDDLLVHFLCAQAAEKKQMLVLSTAPIPKETRAFSKRLPIRTIVLPPEALCRLAEKTVLGSVSEEELEAYILHLVKDTRPDRRFLQEQAFFGGRAKTYLFGAVLLLILSFLTNYTLYYRLLSGLCAGLFAVSLWLDPHGAKNAQNQRQL